MGERNVLCKARHIPGVLNICADQLSRSLTPVSTEWSLNPCVTTKIWQEFGTPAVDLFATCLNNRLPVYMSPCPDQKALAIDALFQDWDGLNAYAFPPWPVLGKVVRKISLTNCSVLLIAPFWPRQSWFIPLLDLLTDIPRSLPDRPDLLFQPGLKVRYANLQRLRLHVWPLSGLASKQKAFRQKWLNWLQRPSGLHQPNNMTPNGISLHPGVLRGVLIQPIPLFQR